MNVQVDAVGNAALGSGSRSREQPWVAWAAPGIQRGAGSCPASRRRLRAAPAQERQQRPRAHALSQSGTQPLPSTVPPRDTALPRARVGDAWETDFWKGLEESLDLVGSKYVRSISRSPKYDIFRREINIRLQGQVRDYSPCRREERSES